ncbi:MAG: dihydrodipicolinate synthase family protein [Promethearchaeota archaeon]
MTSVNGVICNTLSFYNKDYEIDKELNSLLIRHILTNDINSLLLFGNLGERQLFSDKIEEIIKLIELSIEITKKKTPIITGIYGNDVEDIINQIEILAKKFPVLNFMITPPTTKKLDTQEIKSYFENILSSINPKSPIYIHNNPSIYIGNDITPNLITKLLKFSNLRGLNDSFNNIKNCKSFIQILNENFSVWCGMEENSQVFFQLIPIEQRKYSGIVSKISNLVNMFSKLLKYALEDNILELLQLQEQINDIRNKIYFKQIEDSECLSLKYAFLYLYKDLISNSKEYISTITNRAQEDFDSIVKERIEATVNYLVNQKHIYHLYSLGKKDIYQFHDIIQTFSNIDILVKQGKVKKIKGPYKADINTLYKVVFENSKLVFRFRTNGYPQIENIIKEKLLFPFLDKTLTPEEHDLGEKVKQIISKKTGSYIFKKEKPTIIPVSNLIFYDETKQIIPYIFSVQDYIRGKPLFQLVNQYLNEGKNLNTSRFLNLFANLGEHLGHLHNIKFDSYYSNIRDIGGKRKAISSDFFTNELENKIQEAKKNGIDVSDQIWAFFNNNRTLIEEDHEYVLLYNDFQSQNIIVKEELGAIQTNGFVGFDKWCIGHRAQDFVKIEYWILKHLNIPSFFNAFYDAYSKYHKVNNDFRKKIELYKLLWLLNEYNFESDLLRKSKQTPGINISTSSLENYLFEIKDIIRQ